MTNPSHSTGTGLSRLVRGRGGLVMPAFGLGTWRMGENARSRNAETTALKLGLELGVRLIDTAEMYGSGAAEEIVAEATKGRRDELFIVSKVMPQNASKSGTTKAAEASLKRLKTDRIDLYLLHWPGSHPLGDTLEAFERLKQAGKIRHYGLSNFDTDDLARALKRAQGEAIGCNQVLYNLERRGIEARLLPWCGAHEVVVMAYSPLDQARLKTKAGLAKVAARHKVTPEAVAIAWTMRLPHLVTIPKATTPEHVRDDISAASITLSKDDLAALDADYAPPTREAPLEIE